MISVALCTYNGAKYILPQLESIAKQTLIPNEIVICDDGSTDETITLIEHFKLSASFTIRLYRNEQNLGSTKNFEKALSLCNGDIIFLSDQDDIWLPEKVEKIIFFFNHEPEMAVVFTDGYVIDDKRKIMDTLWNRIRFTRHKQKLWKKQKAFEQLMQDQNRATGATMALRRNFLKFLLPFAEMNFWIHDGIITLKSALQNKVTFIDEKLILYRQHNHQQMGLKLTHEKPFQSFTGKVRNRRWINKDEFLEKNYADLKIINEWVKDAEYKKVVNEKMRHFEKRIFANTKTPLFRPFIVLSEWINGNYKKFSCGTNVPSWILVVKDILGK
jgi:glycosyltransferase involved in cell wall biosynthesis